MINIKEIQNEIDNLPVYTLYMGAGEQDKVCVEFSKVIEILDKHIKNDQNS